MSPLKRFLLKLPVVGEYISTRDALAVPGALWALPGHFYSPIPSSEDIDAGTSKTNDSPHKEVLGVDHRLSEQLALVDELAKFVDEVPASWYQGASDGYVFDNDFYGFADGIVLYCMMRQFAPKRIIEVGSGYSSALMNEVNQGFFGGDIDITCIEPFPRQLRDFLGKSGDVAGVTLIEKRVQDVPVSTFERLSAGDFLFIDSSHVTKVNSDVNYLFFEVLPRLRSGVIIHIHDVFAGFEYPREWLVEGRVWNEQYLLRALLMWNERLQVLFMTNYLQENHVEILRDRLPPVSRDRGGSIWLRVV